MSWPVLRYCPSICIEGLRKTTETLLLYLVWAEIHKFFQSMVFVCYQLLVAGLPTLSQLQELDLSCNNISADGVLHLSTVFSNTTAPVLQVSVKHNCDVTYKLG